MKLLTRELSALGLTVLKEGDGLGAKLGKPSRWVTVESLATTGTQASKGQQRK